MHKDKRAIVETLRKYKRHILGPLFTEAADTIEELMGTAEMQKAQIIAMAGEEKPRWILSSERLPEEADGTVLVCFPDVSPYNLKEPYVGAKHNQRVQTGHYSHFSKTWYIGDFCGVGGTEPIAWKPMPEPVEETDGTR